MINRLEHEWAIDKWPDDDGNWTIRIVDGSPNGNTEVEPVATIYGLALAERIVYLHNQTLNTKE